MKSSPIEVQVEAIADLTPHMRRITLSGSGLAEFPDNCAGGYIKLLFDSAKQSKPAMRTYTIRSFDREKPRIDVDFVLHCDQGIASAWASRVSRGDTLKIAGLGPKKPVNKHADWFFLMADLSALPALSVNLEELGEDAAGYALIFIDDVQDRQILVAPQGIKVDWIVMKPETSSGYKSMLDYVEQIAWIRGAPAVWLAGEFEEVKRLRIYFRVEKRIPKDYSYYSSYWKKGLTEPAHKILKQESSKVG